jgi:Pyruvate phosphate dikinase, AMP/ATP-binding domain/Lamin Tail Domain
MEQAAMQKPLHLTIKIALACCVFMLAACGGDRKKPEPPEPTDVGQVRFNEVVAQNEGVYIDEQGELDDWFELANASDTSVNLSQFTISDGGSERIPLPNISLPPGAVMVFWADDSPEQGNTHLPFKISSSGEALTLYDAQQKIVDQVNVPALAVNQAYSRFPSATGQFSVCRYTTPRKSNGPQCQTTAAPVVSDNIQFQPFATSQWPSSVVPAGLAINELAIRPARFIEVKNFSTASVDLSHFSLALGAMSANSPLPSWNTSQRIALPPLTLAPGDVATVDLSAAQTQAVDLQAFNEGAVVLFDNRTRAMQDHVDFMHWPEEATLTRATAAPYAFRFCHNATPNLANACEPLAARTLGNRSRGLYTPADFATLANGSGLANVESVKFVIDLQNNNAVHYLSAQRWPLHYTFVREIIEGKPTLNRCDPFEEQQFNLGWSIFSTNNYSNNQTRRFHLGELSKHANANIHSVEFTFGDTITATQMRDAFYLSTAATSNPFAWSLRPQDASQVTRARSIEGLLPIVGPNAPFQNIALQTLAPGVAFGTLQFIPTDELETAPLGPRVIVITNDVPNDIDFVGGLITEAFQTPLAHVNILSQGRGTPNLALPNARLNPNLMPLIDKLVRFEVTAGGYTLRAASLEEAETFWAENTQNPEVLTPRLDAVTTGLIDLASVNLDALPTIGAKAAQMAELIRVPRFTAACFEGAPFAVPEAPFAIPMSYYLAHFAASGAKSYLATETATNLFKTDLNYRRLVLSTAQQMILQHPVDPALMTLVQNAMQSRFGLDRVRFRSSSNTEDLSTFNGAGLYDSISAEIGSKSLKIDIAIRTVWSSLWNLRAYEERSYANVDQTQVAMGILVHKAFRNERANGVAIARNILDITRTDQLFINSQAGEAAVTNPAPGVITEQLVYQWPPRTPVITYHSRSSLVDGEVITATEVRTLACAMNAIQDHFKLLLDPRNEERWLTMETEFKFLGAERQFLIKQARPYPLGNPNIPNDCREF